MLSFVHIISQSHMTAKHFLSNSSAVEIGHPHYSCDFILTSIIFLSPKGKRALRRQRFHDVMDIKKNVTTKLNDIPLDISDDCPVQLLERCKRPISVKGDNFEGNQENFFLISCFSLS